ncbi:MAG: RNA polymerase sigma factor [Rhodospirillaceae bacterium]|nr:RNA polymerase sigma factor [Rhodospirillaceae bacterium]
MPELALTTIQPVAVQPREEILVARLKAGDIQALEAVMRQYNRRLYRLAWSVLRDPVEAEDVVQETYVRAFTRIGGFVGPRGFGAWLARIALNEARGRLRRGARQSNAGLDEPATEAAMLFLNGGQGPLTPERLAASSELRAALESAIADLPDEFRSVFVLRAVEELSVAETAELLDIPPATVKTRLHRARALLQRRLQQQARQLLPELLSFAGARCDRIVAGVLARLAAGPGRATPADPDTGKE